MYVMTEAVQDLYDKYIDTEIEYNPGIKQDFVVQTNCKDDQI